MNLSPAEGIGIAAAILVLFGVIDAAIAQPMSAWKAAGRNRAAWILLQILIPPLASLVYVLWVRPELGRARP